MSFTLQQEVWHHSVIDMSMAQKGLNCVDIHFKFGSVSKHIGLYIIYVDITHDNNIRTLTFYHTCLYNTQIQHYIAWEHQTFLLLNIIITRSFLFMEFVRCYVSELVIVYILHIKFMFMFVVRWSLYVPCLFIYVVLCFVVCYDIKLRYDISGILFYNITRKKKKLWM